MSSLPLSGTHVVGVDDELPFGTAPRFRSVAGVFGAESKFSQRLQKLAEALVDHSHQQSVPVPEVVLHHTPRAEPMSPASTRPEFKPTRRQSSTPS